MRKIKKVGIAIDDKKKKIFITHSFDFDEQLLFDEMKKKSECDYKNPDWTALTYLCINEKFCEIEPWLVIGNYQEIAKIICDCRGIKLGKKLGIL